MSFELSILGASSAIPSIERFTSSQVLHCRNKNYLIDCGEGMQMRFREMKIKPNKLDNIFITHFHGDHFFGLAGLLSSQNLNARQKPLKVFGPLGLKKYLDSLFEIGALKLDFELLTHEFELKSCQLIHEDEILKVYSFPLNHRVPTSGFLFKEKPGKRNIKKEKIPLHNLSIGEILTLKNSKDIIRKNGETLRFEELTFKAKEPSTYAYVSDTIYDEDIIQHIYGTEVLYHEATYLENMRDKAVRRMHSTAKDAARIAAKASVKQLILGHFSSRYKELDLFKKEAEEIFPNVHLAIDKSKLSLW